MKTILSESCFIVMMSCHLPDARRMPDVPKCRLSTILWFLDPGSWILDLGSKNRCCSDSRQQQIGLATSTSTSTSLYVAYISNYKTLTSNSCPLVSEEAHMEGRKHPIALYPKAWE